MPDTAARLRRTVGAAQRIVVKVGSSSLTSADGGHLDPAALRVILEAISNEIERRGLEYEQPQARILDGQINTSLPPTFSARQPSSSSKSSAAS